MTAILAATILWCLDHADDDPASDCGLTEAEVACIDACLADDDAPYYDSGEPCPGLCITKKRIREICEFPLYAGKDRVTP